MHALHIFRRHAAIARAGLWLSALLLAAGCTRITRPEPPANYAEIGGTEHGIAQMTYELDNIEYPAYSGGVIAPGTSEQGISVRVNLSDPLAADDVSADIAVTIPTRLVGRTIDLSSRDSRPDAEGIYYTFHLSQRGGGLYCRVLSWVTSPDDEPQDHYRGSFRVRRASSITDEYIFEWHVTDPRNDNAVVSEGFVGGVFSRIQ